MRVETRIEGGRVEGLSGMCLFMVNREEGKQGNREAEWHKEGGGWGSNIGKEG